MVCLRTQLYDLLGAALNVKSHEAAIETLVLADSKNVDNAERYLWAASININPKIEIIKSKIIERIDFSIIHW